MSGPYQIEALNIVAKLNDIFVRETKANSCRAHAAEVVSAASLILRPENITILWTRKGIDHQIAQLENQEAFDGIMKSLQDVLNDPKHVLVLQGLRLCEPSLSNLQESPLLKSRVYDHMTQAKL